MYAIWHWSFCENIDNSLNHQYNCNIAISTAFSPIQDAHAWDKFIDFTGFLCQDWIPQYLGFKVSSAGKTVQAKLLTIRLLKWANQQNAESESAVWWQSSKTNSVSFQINRGLCLGRRSNFCVFDFTSILFKKHSEKICWTYIWNIVLISPWRNIKAVSLF